MIPCSLFGPTEAITGADHRSPSRERLIAMPLEEALSTSDATSQNPCVASYATAGSLARCHCPRGEEKTVSAGRRPCRHVRPASRETEKPVFSDPPSAKRPTWNTATTVEPHAKLSGSTSLACCAGSRRGYGSKEIRRVTVSQPERRSDGSAWTTSAPAPHETTSRPPPATSTRSFPPRATTRS